MAVRTLTVKTVETASYQDQKPGTSGLRRKVKVFQKDHYVANFVQSILESLRDRLKGCTLIVGGDGRFFNEEAIQIIIAVCAGNGVGKVMVAQNGIMSTPAISGCIRKYQTAGGIILTASHNPGGPDEDFGIKFNVANGGPASDAITEEIYNISKKLKQYKLVDGLDKVDLKTLGTTEFNIADSQDKFVVHIIDGIAEYIQMMQQIFDFEKLRKLFRAPAEGKQQFRVLINGMNGVTGPYIKRIFVDELKAPADSVIKADPLPDFGGHHPDPNLTYAADLVKDMEGGKYDFGAAFDGDGDRNMILGKNAFFVTPGDSLAVIADNADLIPHFVKTGIKGFARSMPTSGAVDLVAEAKGHDMYEVPTGWKYFGNLMDANKLSLCGEESFGTGSDHIREKDGIWAALAWLQILAHQDQPSVEATVKRHWSKYGRNFYTRYDYEACRIHDANKVMALMESYIQDPNFVGRELLHDGHKFKVKKADNFDYKDTVDGSVARDQGKRFVFEDGSRVIFRLSGTGSSGATIRIYCDFYEGDRARMELPTSEALKPLVEMTLYLSQVNEITNREGPTVIT